MQQNTMLEERNAIEKDESISELASLRADVAELLAEQPESCASASTVGSPAPRFRSATTASYRGSWCAARPRARASKPGCATRSPGPTTRSAS